MEYEHISEDGKSWSCHGLHYVSPGDHLTILKDGEEIFSGVIKAYWSKDPDDGKVFIDEPDLVVGWI